MALSEPVANIGEEAAIGIASPGLKADVTTTAFIQALGQTKRCIMDVAGTWRFHEQIQLDLMESLREHSTGRNFNSALYWLFLRLGKSSATLLVHCTAKRM